MTNFEKWKEGLTVDWLGDIIDCEYCPAYDMCQATEDTLTDEDGIELHCPKPLYMWANQEAEEGTSDGY